MQTLGGFVARSKQRVMAWKDDGWDVARFDDGLGPSEWKPWGLSAWACLPPALLRRDTANKRWQAGTGHGPWALGPGCLGQRGSLQRPAIQARIIPGRQTEESPGSVSREGVCGGGTSPHTRGEKLKLKLHFLALPFECWLCDV